jgi:hypothetical protein
MVRLAGCGGNFESSLHTIIKSTGRFAEICAVLLTDRSRNQP